MLMLCSFFGLLVFFGGTLGRVLVLGVTVLGAGLVGFLGGHWRYVFCRMKKTICTWAALMQGVHRDRSDRALRRTVVLKMAANHDAQTPEHSGPRAGALCGRDSVGWDRLARPLMPLAVATSLYSPPHPLPPVPPFPPLYCEGGTKV